MSQFQSAIGRPRGWAVILGILGVLLATPMGGQEKDSSPNSEASLVSSVMSIQPGTPFTVAVSFQLDPGWHNYWRNAGDSGLPTAVEWTLPAGFEAGELQWPLPHRIVAGPLVDYGYSDQVALLVEITPPADLTPGESVTLEALVDWLICEKICLPAFAELSLSLPVEAGSPRADPRWTGLFADTRAAIPPPVAGWTVEAEVTEGGYRVSVAPKDETLAIPDSVYFYPEETGILDHAAPQVNTVTQDRLVLELAASPYALQPSATLAGVLVVEDGGGWDPDRTIPAVHIETDVAGAPEPQEAAVVTAEPTTPSSDRGLESSGFTLGLALIFALVGGLLLNLMPCVFPILSLKILGAVGQGGGDRARVRNQGLVFGLGVILAFLALAGLLIVLRAGGGQLGWGFQLQSPTFVGFMAALFFAIGLNLMGMFEIGASLTRVGGRVGEPAGYGDALASGALATVIATPCTAPFMGAALGFALTRSIPETLLIFGSLGLGMALPYVILSVAPGLLERLPKPGAWMETLRNVLAFPMFATVIWLVWVFGQQTGVGGAAYLLSALLMVTAAGWMVGRWTRTDRRSGVAARAVSLVALAIGAVFLLRGSDQEGPRLAVSEGWQAFSQAEVERTVAEGTPVFVDFTAAWCLTCQVNERVVLSTEVVQEAFRQRGVALFKADWTRQDPAITAALEALGRNGVPVYALYPGGSGASPRILPAILTERIVLDALDETLSSGPT